LEKKIGSENLEFDKLRVELPERLRRLQEARVAEEKVVPVAPQAQLSANVIAGKATPAAISNSAEKARSPH
jgi:hypothetical protein